MREARSSISISFDLWTSPNCLAVLGVVAHFIDKNGQRRAAVLGLRELMGEHSGENMAEVLLQIFKDYKIGGRIGYFMADNATSNDTRIHAVTVQGTSKVECDLDEVIVHKEKRRVS